MPEPDATPFEPLLSEYRLDADMVELVELFVSEMPERLDALAGAFRSGDLDRLRTESHRLRGAAGGYGYPQLTHAAARLEDALRGQCDLDAIRAEFDELITLCQRVR